MRPRLRPNFKIVVKTLQGNILTYSVENYAILEGNFISFLDQNTNKIKKFHCSNVEIENLEDKNGL